MVSVGPFNPTRAEYVVIVDLYEAVWPDERHFSGDMCARTTRNSRMDLSISVSALYQMGASLVWGAALRSIGSTGRARYTLTSWYILIMRRRD